jgi:hypothetical protein
LLKPSVTSSFSTVSFRVFFNPDGTCWVLGIVLSYYLKPLDVQVSSIMDSDVNALIRAADKVHWEEEALFTSVDEHLIVNKLTNHPGAHIINDVKVGDPHLTSQISEDFCIAQTYLHVQC